MKRALPSAAIGFRCSLALVVLAALLGLTPPAEAAFPGSNGKIAFSCGGVICTINPDGTQEQEVNQHHGASPAWSPDGTRIAFEGITTSPSNTDIYVMNADGTGLAQITTSLGRDEDPAWSPNGAAIVFTSNRDDPNPSSCGFDCNFNLYVMPANGSEQIRITVLPLVESDPSWEPNGARIAFGCETGQAPGKICLINPDGSGLVNNLGDGTHPNWLPDGSKIAFGLFGNILAMNPDGTGRTTIAERRPPGPPPDGGTNLAEPAWAPDGTAFADTVQSCGTPSGGCNPRIVETRNADGTPLRGFACLCLRNDREPDWQPAAPSSNVPPDCSGVTATPDTLRWNRKFVLVSLSGATDPDGDEVSLTVTGVTQDERVTGPGDHTTPDAMPASAGDQVRLRAERSPRGDGRVYGIDFTASDGSAQCSGMAQVAVPRSHHGSAVDSAPPSYDSFGS